MSESQYLLERAKRAATKAIEAERSGDTKVAFESFLKAAEFLNQLITIERSQKLRDSYYEKAKEYIRRAKEIKTLTDTPKKSIVPKNDLNDDFPDISSKSLPTPPKTSPTSQPPERKTIPPPPPPPTDDDYKPLPPPTKQTPPLPPPPPEDRTSKMMRGDEDIYEVPPPSRTAPPPSAVASPKPKVELPTRTTFEILFDEGKYRECVLECAKSVEAELRVRLGLFDDHLTLGMLIEHGLKKGLDVLKEFKYVNILLNRIVHENYRPKAEEAKKAVEVTTKIVMS
ncbi:MAG: hypothetical protein JXA54_17280 [Candidatus Heimdallarchaeota archaeon]|nr:hypothetical protein [Candidatus Heimdallarchaeota archaeon]